MKINYRKNGDGERSTITLNDELIETWIAVLEHEYLWKSREEAMSKLVEKIEETSTEGQGTFVSRVEGQMMRDMRSTAKQLAMMLDKLEKKHIA